MVDDQVKSITLSGPAATEYVNSTGIVNKPKKANNTRRRVKQEDGTDALSVPPVIRVDTSKAIVSDLATPTPTPVPVPVPVPATPSPIEEQSAGAKQIKVELKRKGTAKKVHLQPKRTEPIKKANTQDGTKKVRRFTLGLSSFHRRMTRAKKMEKKMKEMPLDKLKEHLVQKKLIKPTSKAPESVLRRIAADSQILSGKAL